jgi:hypothetical protein
MHQHRSAGRPGEVAPPGTVEHEHQRRLLLELAVDPPERGDAIAELARTLGLAVEQVEAAAAALERAGLAERREGRLFATPAVAAVERLWPFGL